MPDAGLGVDVKRRAAGTGHINAIACGPVGCVQLLTFDGGGFPGAPTLALSANLRTWTSRVATGRGLDASVQSIAASGKRYVLAGGGAWWSEDARTWKRGRTTRGAAVPVSTAASDGSSFIAWKHSMAHRGIWYSRTGRTWTPIRLPGAPALIVDAVSSIAGGGYVLAGRSGPSIQQLDAEEAESVQFSARPGRQRVWTSVDGRTWVPVAIARGMEDVRLTSIAAGGPGGGLVATGWADAGTTDVEPAPGVWRWTAAGGWQQLKGRRFAWTSPNGSTALVVASPGAWLLIGGRRDASLPDDTTPEGIMAGSSDGATWWGSGPVELDGRGHYVVDAVGWKGGRLLLGINRYWTGMQIGSDFHEVWASPR